MGLRATLFFFFVFPCFCLFLYLLMAWKIIPAREKPRDNLSSTYKPSRYDRQNMSFYVCICVCFYQSLFVDSSHKLLFLPANFFLFVCVCQIKQTARQPRQPTGYGHYFTSSITWSLFHHAYSSSSAGLTSKALLD